MTDSRLVLLAYAPVAVAIVVTPGLATAGEYRPAWMPVHVEHGVGG